MSVFGLRPPSLPWPLTVLNQLIFYRPPVTHIIFAQRTRPPWLAWQPSMLYHNPASGLPILYLSSLLLCPENNQSASPSLLGSTPSRKTLQAPLRSQWPVLSAANLVNIGLLSLPVYPSVPWEDPALCPSLVCEGWPLSLGYSLWLCDRLSCGLCAPTRLSTSRFSLHTLGHSEAELQAEDLLFRRGEFQPSWLVSDFCKSGVIGWMLP